MTKIKNFFQLIVLSVTCSCFCKIAIVNFLQINPGDSRPYSIGELPERTSPSSNSTVSVIFSPGLKILHCDLSSNNEVTSSNVCIAITIQNRMASRFSNSILGQVYNSVYYEIVKSAIVPLWENYITSQTATSVSSITSCKTSGISALIELPGSEFLTGIDILSKFYTLIQQLSITDSMITDAFTSSYNKNINNSFMQIGSSTLSQNSSENSLMLALKPRLDATTTNGGSRQDDPAIPCGSCSAYDNSIIRQESTNPDGIEYIKYLHQLILNERTFLVFSSSKDINVKNKLALCAVDLIKKLSPTYIGKINIPCFGDSFKRGLEHVYDQPNNTGDSGLAGYINFGRISINSILAAGLVIKITKNGAFNPPFDGAAIKANICIFGGNVQLRISLSYQYISGTVSEAWRSYTNALSSRYSTTSNDSDFSTYIGIISELIKHFSPGSVNGNANFTEYGLSDIYNDNPTAYVIWMEIFYGAFNILKELQELNEKGLAEKTTAIENAAKALINSSHCSAAQTMCIRIE